MFLLGSLASKVLGGVAQDALGGITGSQQQQQPSITNSVGSMATGLIGNVLGGIGKLFGG